jgi:hypothetical protein
MNSFYLIMYDIQIRTLCEETNRYRVAMEELRQAMLKYQMLFDKLVKLHENGSQEFERMVVD